MITLIIMVIIKLYRQVKWLRKLKCHVGDNEVYGDKDKSSKVEQEEGDIHSIRREKVRFTTILWEKRTCSEIRDTRVDEAVDVGLLGCNDEWRQLALLSRNLRGVTTQKTEHRQRTVSLPVSPLVASHRDCVLTDRQTDRH